MLTMMLRVVALERKEGNGEFLIQGMTGPPYMTTKYNPFAVGLHIFPKE